MRSFVCLLLCACTHAAVKPDAPKSETLKPWAEATAETTRKDGFLPILQRRDNAVLLELAPSHLDHDFGLVQTLAKGTGTLTLVDGFSISGWDAVLVRLHRAGDKVYLIQRNTIPRATGALAVSIARDSGDSVIGAFPVISDDKTKILVDATEFFVTDQFDIRRQFMFDTLDKPDTKRALDRARSYVDRVRTFPKNVEIDAVLTFTSDRPKLVPINPAIDPRATTVTVRWSLFALPEKPMAGRRYDERVGYFATTIRDYAHAGIADIDSDGKLIHRWRLEKKDPKAAHSPPLEPIRYYLDPSIPAEYKPFVRDGILAWNRAFAEIGIDDAIVVADAPAADYDPNDLRYNVIRWSTTNDLPFYAYGPAEADPRTGEQLHAQVVVAADLIRDFGQGLRVETGKAAGCGAAASGDLAFARLGAAAGVIDFDGHLGPYLRALMMHEIGHTLGLRHNFRASTAIPYDKLHDKAYTAEHGTTASVMDYTWINIATDPAKQGDFYTTRLGAYDTFAIAYGYASVPGEDPAALAKLATSDNPEHAFATDDDVYNVWTIDPAVARFDAGDDLARFTVDKLTLIDRVRARIGDALVAQGAGWGAARDYAAFLFTLRTNALTNLLATVGGTSYRRLHRGQIDLPVKPLPVETQRKALAIILDNAFSETGYALPPELMAAPPRRDGSLAQVDRFPIDVPIHRMAADRQQALVRALFATPRLHRIVDNQARGSTLTIAELFATAMTSAFSELSANKPVGTMRRNVQRIFVEALVNILIAKDARTPIDVTFDDTYEIPETDLPAPPEDARAAARHELAELAKKLAAAKPADLSTREHFEELAARVQAALTAHVVY